MEQINVKIRAQEEYSYPIFIGENLIENAYEIIKKYTKANKFLVVTNEKVYPLYGEKLKNENSEFIVLPDGEEYKTMEYLNKILDKAFEMHLERKDCIIALGGGVTGDIAGFAAATCQRGIDFIQIPTTLLAQVDSSVGGKVAVNHAKGKTLIGNFYQPKVVISDVFTLKTLDERQYKTGLSEVIKYSFIEESCNSEEKYNLIDFLENNADKIKNRDSETLSKIISTCCKLKATVVNQDEKEKGLRAILNFGHTYAHAIENITEYKKYTHGEAVSIGMKQIFDLAKSLNLVSSQYYERALNLLNEFDLITKLDTSYDKDLFYTKMFSDKKVQDNKLNFVMPIEEKTVKIMNNIDKNIIIKGI